MGYALALQNLNSGKFIVDTGTLGACQSVDFDVIVASKFVATKSAPLSMERKMYTCSYHPSV
jgi:hypothetical protein